MRKLVLFASGNGSNAAHIMRHFESHPGITVTAIFTNNPTAGVIAKAAAFNVPVLLVSKTELNHPDFLKQLETLQPDLIVLAGFLLLFPKLIIEAYPDQIINIHPALLPKYGGKGMYGSNVHQAVYENKEKESGITIHYVNEHYDKGSIILQQKVNIEDCKNAEAIATKVQQLEHQFFPITIQKLLK